MASISDSSSSPVCQPSTAIARVVEENRIRFLAPIQLAMNLDNALFGILMVAVSREPLLEHSGFELTLPSFLSGMDVLVSKRRDGKASKTIELTAELPSLFSQPPFLR